jgi:hypothetical protein
LGSQPPPPPEYAFEMSVKSRSHGMNHLPSLHTSEKHTVHESKDLEGKQRGSDVEKLTRLISSDMRRKKFRRNKREIFVPVEEGSGP